MVLTETLGRQADGKTMPGHRSDTKALLIGLLLTALALWPMLHYALVQRYFVSPWRLFGWAMYCVPVYQPTVKFLALRGDEELEIRFPRQRPDDDRAYAHFVRHRAELGTLVEPHELGHILFATYPQFDAFIVHVIQPVYHYDSDQIRQAFFEYRLERVD